MQPPDIAERAEHLAKARENLTCAEAELAAGRYNTCASRAYYAAWHAAVAALIESRERPTGVLWSHEFVIGRFAGCWYIDESFTDPTFGTCSSASVAYDGWRTMVPAWSRGGMQWRQWAEHG